MSLICRKQQRFKLRRLGEEAMAIFGLTVPTCLGLRSVLYIVPEVYTGQLLIHDFGLEGCWKKLRVCLLDPCVVCEESGEGLNSEVWVVVPDVISQSCTCKKTKGGSVRLSK